MVLVLLFFFCLPADSLFNLADIELLGWQHEKLYRLQTSPHSKKEIVGHFIRVNILLDDDSDFMEGLTVQWPKSTIRHLYICEISIFESPPSDLTDLDSTDSDSLVTLSFPQPNLSHFSSSSSQSSLHPSCSFIFSSIAYCSWYLFSIDLFFS